MDGSFNMNTRHWVWKATTRIEKGKNKLAQRAALHAVYPYVWILTYSQALEWPGHMVRRMGSGRLDYKRVLFRGMAIWKSPWKSEGCIQTGHVNAHQKNPLPASEDVLQIMSRHPSVLTWGSHWVNEVRGLKQCREGLTLDIFLLHPWWHKMPTGTVLSANKRDLGTADGYGEDALQGVLCTVASPTDAWSTGGYKWVLTEMDTDSGLSLLTRWWKQRFRVLRKNWSRRYCTDPDHWVTFLQTKEHTLQPIMFNNGQRDSFWE